jgi:hypothetical protein
MTSKLVSGSTETCLGSPRPSGPRRTGFPNIELALDGFVIGLAPSRPRRGSRSAGWTLPSREVVTWLRSATLAEDVERLKLRSVSAFEQKSDEVVQEGFARIEAALPSLGDGPQYETSEMLVFQR